MPRAHALRKGKHGHDEKLAMPTVVDSYLT